MAEALESDSAGLQHLSNNLRARETPASAYDRMRYDFDASESSAANEAPLTPEEEKKAMASQIETINIDPSALKGVKPKGEENIDEIIERQKAETLLQFQQTGDFQSLEQDALEEPEVPSSPHEIKGTRGQTITTHHAPAEENPLVTAGKATLLSAGQLVKHGVAGATIDVAQEVGNFAIDSANTFDGWMRKYGITERDLVDDKLQLDFADKILPKPQDPALRTARSVAGYLAPFGASLKLVKGGTRAARIWKAVGAGATTAFMAVDPDDDSLGELVQKEFNISNPAMAFLANQEGDSRIQKRAKNALESVLVDTTLAAALSSNLLGKARSKFFKHADEAVEETVQSGAKESQVLEENVKQPGKMVETDAASPSLKIPDLEAEDFWKKVEAADTLEDIIPGCKVNLTKMVSTDEAKKFIRVLASENKGSLQEARRGIITQDESVKKALEIANNPEKMAEIGRRQAGQVLPPEELKAAQIFLASTMKDLQKMSEIAAKSGNAVDQAVLNENLHNWMQIYNSYFGSAAEFGRGLNILKVPVAEMADSIQLRYFHQMVKANGGIKEMDSMTQLFKAAMDMNPADLLETGGKIVRKTAFMKMNQVLHTIYINGLLSGVKTTSLNIVNGLARGPIEIIERGIAAGFGKVRGGTDRVFFSEVGQQSRAYMTETFNQASAITTGMADSIVSAADAVRRGEAFNKLAAAGRVKPQSKFNSVFSEAEDLAPAISAKNLGYTGTLGDFVDAIGAVISAPSRALVKTDNAIGSIHYRMEARALAAREAASRGLTGAEADTLIRQLADDPIDSIGLPDMRKLASGIRGQAIETANVNKFTNALDGSLATIDNAIKTGGEELLGVAPMKFLTPFSRVGLNIANQTFERTPFALLSKKYKDAIKVGGATADLARAKVAMGSGMMTMGMMLAWSGNLTGNGPANAQTRKLMEANGWQPNSIRVGNKWVKYDKVVEPFGRMLAASADMADNITYLGQSRMEDIDQVAMSSAMTVAETMTPEFMTTTMADTLDVIRNPSAEKKLDSMVAKQAVSTVVPFSSLLRSIRTGEDPVKRDVSEDPNNYWGMWDRMHNEFKNTIPGLSKDLPVQRNMFGEELYYPAGYGPDILSPIAATDIKNDPTLDELIRLGITGPLVNPTPKKGESHLVLSMPDRKINMGIGGGRMVVVNLTPKQYERLVILSSGKGLEAQPYPGMTLKEAFDFEISNGYPNIGLETDEARRIMLSTIHSAYKEAALRQLQSEDMEIQEQMQILSNQFQGALVGEGE